MSDSDEGEVIRICSPHSLQESNPAFAPFSPAKPSPSRTVDAAELLSDVSKNTQRRDPMESVPVFANFNTWIQQQHIGSPGGASGASSNATPQAPSPGVHIVPLNSPASHHPNSTQSTPIRVDFNRALLQQQQISGGSTGTWMQGAHQGITIHPIDQKFVHQRAPSTGGGSVPPSPGGVFTIPYGMTLSHQPMVTVGNHSRSAMEAQLAQQHPQLVVLDRSPKSPNSQNATPNSAVSRSKPQMSANRTGQSQYQPQQPVHIPVQSLSEPSSAKASPAVSVQLSGAVQSINSGSLRSQNHQSVQSVGPISLGGPLQHPTLVQGAKPPLGLNIGATPFQIPQQPNAMCMSPLQGFSNVPVAVTSVGLQSLLQSPGTANGFSPQQPHPITVEGYKGKIAETAKDQFGCRCLQRTLEQPWDTPEVQLIFNELSPCFSDLMANAYGNFLAQKVLDVAPDEARLELVKCIALKLPGVGTTPHGTFAVQKLIESARSRDERTMICDGLASNIPLLAMDANGGHVLHKVLSCLAPEDRQFVTNAICKDMARIARDKNGCCIVQRCIERSVSVPETQIQLAKAISDHVHLLLPDPYGNYVVQCLIEKSFSQSSIIDLVVQAIGRTGPTGFQLLCVNQFSSKAVEKAFVRCSKRQSAQLLEDCGLTSRHDLLQVILLDNFGNYIVQTFLAQAMAVFSAAAKERHAAAQFDLRRKDGMIPPFESAPVQTIDLDTVAAFAALLQVVARAMPQQGQQHLPGFVKKIEVKLEQANRQYQLFIRGTPTPTPATPPHSAPPTPQTQSPARIVVNIAPLMEPHIQPLPQ